MMHRSGEMDAEKTRLKEERTRKKHWKRWGPYLSERQWGTVREDYSADGSCWDYFPHDDARSRAYRWGEDGLLGICDRQCRLCLSLVVWNTWCPIMKERLFGLPGVEGNHGEDVKELYYYLDNTPTHSYMKALYKYPHISYPYSKTEYENAERTRLDPEYEVLDTGVFNDQKYYDIFVEFAKNSPNDILCKYTVCNRGSDTVNIHMVPMLWFRNTWSWGCPHEACEVKPFMKVESESVIDCWHETLGSYKIFLDKGPKGNYPELMFTDNETNYKRLYKTPNPSPYIKDAFHWYIIHGHRKAINPAGTGTRFGANYMLTLGPHEEAIIRVRLSETTELPDDPFANFDAIVSQRKAEADLFYDEIISSPCPREYQIARQAYAGLLWSKQFYHYIMRDWLDGDENGPAPPGSRLHGRNHDWRHMYNRDIIAMPDKWEYPWYASWDLAFHCIAYAQVDIDFAKQQLLLFLREWYMHPNGQIPAYEFNFSDVNPPVHAYAVLKVFKASGPKGKRDMIFLARCFQKLILNFTWWVNRKDPDGRNLFAGGFLGFDNIGVFDRSLADLPGGGQLEQADGTAWMAFFCIIMVEISLILAEHEFIYEDMASKFFEHFVTIVDAMNKRGDGQGLWNEEDGFYYDHVRNGDKIRVVRIRSMVGFIPMFSSLVLKETETEAKFPEFYSRMMWFLENRKDLSASISFMVRGENREEDLLLSVLKESQLRRILQRMLDETEFLSPYGIRSLSKVYKDNPYVFSADDGSTYSVDYEPSESTTYMFGGNSNWRGPVWFCMNYLIVENLQRYDYFFGDTFTIECPTGSGHFMRLRDVARELSTRLCKLFLPDETGHRPAHGEEEKYAKEPYFKDLVLFYEYFDGDNGRGCGASHQTGWTALVVDFLKTMHGIGAGGAISGSNLSLASIP